MPRASTVTRLSETGPFFGLLSAARLGRGSTQLSLTGSGTLAVRVGSAIKLQTRSSLSGTGSPGYGPSELRIDAAVQAAPPRPIRPAERAGRPDPARRSNSETLPDQA
jgi:hypothetical protein